MVSCARFTPGIENVHGFPQVRCFDGRVQTAESAGAPLASQAVFYGCVVVTSWPRDDVRVLLPDDLEPASDVSGSSGRHPVVFLLGDQRRGAVIFAGIEFPSRLVYQEFTMAVPFVRHRSGRFLHIYLPRMVSSFLPATWVGNRAYGFAKCSGRIEREDRVHAVRDDTGGLLLRACVDVRDSLEDAARCNFETLRTWFELPVTGIRSDGRYVSSYWRLDFRGARVSAAEASVEIHAPFARGVVPGRHASVAHGSFGVEGMVWRLSWPVSCRF